MSPRTVSRELLLALRMAQLLVAELNAFAVTLTAIPRERLLEISDSLLALTFEQQKSWDALPPNERQAIDHARREMVVARQVIDSRCADAATRNYLAQSKTKKAHAAEGRAR